MWRSGVKSMGGENLEIRDKYVNNYESHQEGIVQYIHEGGQYDNVFHSENILQIFIRGCA